MKTFIKIFKGHDKEIEREIEFYSREFHCYPVSASITKWDDYSKVVVVFSFDNTHKF